MGINDMFKGIRRDIGRKIGGDDSSGTLRDRDYEESRYRDRNDDEERDNRDRYDDEKRRYRNDYDDEDEESDYRDYPSGTLRDWLRHADGDRDYEERRYRNDYDDEDEKRNYRDRYDDEDDDD
ncbi:MAG: polyribonucleotide nucleotidyltransferase [Waterburya sp.]